MTENDRRELRLRKRSFDGRAFRRRKGMGLVLALGVMLVGSLLTALIYEITFHYAWFRQPQKAMYVNHTTVLDAIQAMKGFIIETNSADNRAMHVPNLDFNSTDITNVSVLRFSNPELKIDTDVRSGVGAQRLTVDVYDLYYNPANLNDSVWNDPDQVKELPPPFNLTASFEMEGVGDDGGEGHNADVSDLLGSDVVFNPQKYGAYLIRARLFDSSRLVRAAEEVFIQVLE